MEIPLLIRSIGQYFCNLCWPSQTPEGTQHKQESGGAPSGPRSLPDQGWPPLRRLSQEKDPCLQAFGGGQRLGLAGAGGRMLAARRTLPARALCVPGSGSEPTGLTVQPWAGGNAAPA